MWGVGEVRHTGRWKPGPHKHQTAALGPPGPGPRAQDERATKKLHTHTYTHTRTHIHVYICTLLLLLLFLLTFCTGKEGTSKWEPSFLFNSTKVKKIYTLKFLWRSVYYCAGDILSYSIKNIDDSFKAVQVQGMLLDWTVINCGS